MLSAIRALFSPKPARRSLEAAGGGRRWSDDRRINSARALEAGAGTVAARAAHFASSNPTGAKVVDSLVSNVIGAGIKPRSGVESEAVRARLHRRWRSWTDAADMDGRGDFYALQAALVRDMVVLGEALAVFSTEPATGAPQLRRLHPSQLDSSVNRRADGGGYIVSGVEFDAAGRRVAYHIRPGFPGDAYGVMPLTPDRIPAGDVVHLFRPLMPGQVRGVSWLAPILLTARELDALADAMLVRAKVAALFAGVVTDTDGTGLVDSEQNGGALEASLEPGALVSLPPGKTVEFPQMPDQGGATALMTSTMRLIATGAGVTSEQASGDYSQVNYSSARAAMLEFRKFCEGVQHHVVVFQLLRPVWQRFVRFQVLTGGLSAAAYSADRAASEQVDWLPPAWPQVDPAKEIEAQVAAVRAGFKSRSEVIAERGLDAEDVDRAIAADAARLSRLGVVLEPGAAS
jgi:lambda family phage portal protein